MRGLAGDVPKTPPAGQVVVAPTSIPEAGSGARPRGVTNDQMRDEDRGVATKGAERGVAIPKARLGMAVLQDIGSLSRELGRPSMLVKPRS